MHDVGPKLRGEPAQLPRRPRLVGRAAAQPGEGVDLDGGVDGGPHVLRGLGAAAVGDGHLVAGKRHPLRHQANHLEHAASEGFDDVEDAQPAALLSYQYAPRPESTAGSVARRISMSRASDQPATYW